MEKIKKFDGKSWIKVQSKKISKNLKRKWMSLHGCVCICTSPRRKASDCKGPIRAKLKRVNCLLRKKGSSNSASDKES